MRHLVLATVAAVALLGVGSAKAGPTHVERATMATIGCYTLDDMQEIVHAGAHTTSSPEGHAALNDAINSKVASGRCFGIAEGSGSVFDMRWESPPLIWNGVVKLRGMGNRFFYSPAWAWRALPD